MSTRPAAQAAERTRKKQTTHRQRQRAVAWGGGVLIVALLAAIAVAAITAADRAGTASRPPGAVVVPTGATADGAIAVGQAAAPVTITVFFDYMCPFCGRFESANSADLDRLVNDGQARLELCPMSFLDGQSKGSEYSTRAVNALATVADAAPNKTWAFHRALFAAQPEEGTAGPDDDRLVEIARQVGVPSDVAGRFGDRTFDPWAAQATERAFSTGVQGTPAVLINGQRFTGDLYRPGPLADAVRAATPP